MFQNHFAVPDEGWFVFANYLRDQVASGHTTSYDPAAVALPAGKDWKGWAMARRVQLDSPTLLTITTKQVADWVSGTRTRMKSASNNPFASDAVASSVG